jgi:hypothetical protein
MLRAAVCAASTVDRVTLLQKSKARRDPSTYV